MTTATSSVFQPWQVTLLPNPKKFTRSRVLGFCGGHAVGLAENARARIAACWWPGGQPELLTIPGREFVQAAFAHGNRIPGSWWPKSNVDYRAVAWHWLNNALTVTELHDARFERTWATGAGGDLVVGVGTPKGKLGHRGGDLGLVWRGAALAHELRAEGDVSLRATDGVAVAGSANRRATLWPAPDKPPVDLAPASTAGSEVTALDGDTQAGIAWIGLRARAAFWRGSAASFADLTPKGFEVGSALDAGGGLQAGFIRRKDVTLNGSTSLANQAALWHGDAAQWIDLNDVLPAKGDFNASIAWAIDVQGNVVRVGGAVSRYEVRDPDTNRESHSVPAEQAVIWTAARR